MAHKRNISGIEKHKFKKGQSGNPKGRKKKLPELDVILDEVLGSETDGRSAAKDIIKALILRAKRGDVRAAEVILDRAYGKAKQDVNLRANISITDQPVEFS